MQLHRLRRLPAHPDVQHLDNRGERHGEVDIATRHVPVEPLGDERDADHNQEAQRQDLGAIGVASLPLSFHFT